MFSVKCEGCKDMPTCQAIPSTLSDWPYTIQAGGEQTSQSYGLISHMARRLTNAATWESGTWQRRKQRGDVGRVPHRRGGKRTRRRGESATSQRRQTNAATWGEWHIAEEGNKRGEVGRAVHVASDWQMAVRGNGSNGARC
jgi:hypothetical protein